VKTDMSGLYQRNNMHQLLL